MSDLEKAFTALNAKKPIYDEYFAYYDGDQPVMYTAKRLEELFKGLDADFTENWAAVVIDAVRDRINMISIRGDEDTQEVLNYYWDESELKLESDAVHEAALVTGEAFVIVWPDEEGVPQAYYNDPRLVHCFYDAEQPRVMTFAAKWWVTDDKNTRMTLYYHDRLEYYEAKGNQPAMASAFQALETSQAPNPYNQIPVFHFRLGRRGKGSDLKNVIPIQNGINKLLADMMVAAEYGAFKQRYVISNADVQGKLKNAPNEVWDLPAGDGTGQETQAGEFDITPLENYLKAINDLSMAISSITRTPKHYFFQIGSNLSGEALDAMEDPLNKKAKDRIDAFKPVWQAVAAFMLTIGGMTTNKRDVDAVFEPPRTQQPFTEAQTIQMYTAAQIPLKTAARRVGWTSTEIEQMEQDRAEEQASLLPSLGQALLEAQRQFDQGGQI